MSDVTQLLSAIDAGDPKAADQLLPLVYGELRKLAVVRMANEKAGQTLQPTALVHEAWLKIAGDGNQQLSVVKTNLPSRVLIEPALPSGDESPAPLRERVRS